MANNRSFFGGDTSLAHWSVDVRYKASKTESAFERRVRRTAECETLKAAGITKAIRFQFRVKDEAAKAKAKLAADAKAAEIEATTGVKMDVCEGCFL